MAREEVASGEEGGGPSEPRGGGVGGAGVKGESLHEAFSFPAH